ncbi:MAG: phosphoesterase, partial [Candidatus Eisenbacteria bacterium]|nr:phosphoesterase [Candidatus Eisenbacteria bacterium]
MSRGHLSQIRKWVEDAGRILVLTHDNPDPDALASAWALRRVFQRMGCRNVQTAYSGIVGRAENRFMIDILRIPIEPAADKHWERADTVALVDCQPGAGNVSLPRKAPAVRFVLDHHPLRQTTRRIDYYDVRPEVGATATMAAEYLERVGVRLDRRLATALFHAIRTETQNLGREASRTDARQFSRLFPLVDNQALSRIEMAPIPRAYFSMMNHAINGTRI